MNQEIQPFVQEIMSLDAANAGMGAASAGITGVTNTDNDTVFALRKSAMDFAAEYSKEAPDHELVTQAAGKVEGALRSLHLTAGIAEDKLAQLLTALNGFVEKALAK